MTPEERANVLRSLPSIRDDMGWVTIPIPQRRDTFNQFVCQAAQLYQLGHSASIANVKRERVERKFYHALSSLPWLALEPIINAPTKDNLYPALMLARLRGATLPAPLEYFLPDEIANPQS